MYHALESLLLLPHHAMSKYDKTHNFWITSNDHFTTKFIFFFKPKGFWMFHLNDHLYSKSCVFLWVANFRGPTARFANLPTHSRAFTVRHICITKNNRAFTQGGIYPYLLLPNTYFHFHVYNRVTLLDFVPLYRANTIKHQTQC